MFGNRVTDFDQSAIGEYGYILKLDITKLQASDIVAVQAQVNGGHTLSPSLAKISLTSLQMLLSFESQTQLAFCFLDSYCFIFFNSAVFPYVNSTRFILDYVRGINTAQTDSDLLDIADRFMGLVKLYALRSAYVIAKGITPRNVLDEISRVEPVVRKSE